jgi:hypothetical protein
MLCKRVYPVLMLNVLAGYAYEKLPEAVAKGLITEE